MLECGLTEAIRFMNISVLETARRAVYQKCAEGTPAFFIENFCMIEDRDADGILVPFALWPAQKDVLSSIEKNKLNIILKARQLGLSWLCLCYCLYKMLFTEGYSVIALSKNDDEAKELVRRMEVLIMHMPQLLRGKGAENWRGPIFVKTEHLIKIVFKDIESTFRAFPSGANTGRSFTASLLFLDEWAFQQFARNIWLATYPTINRPTGGKVLGISTIDRGTLFEDLFNNKNNNFNKLFLPWNADPRRTPEWYEQTKRDLGDNIMQEYPASTTEAFAIPGGAFFPELRAHVHCRPTGIIPPDWRKYVALDYGLDRLACLWICVDGQGREHVYRELCVSGLIASEAAHRIAEAGQGDKIYQYLAPPDLWNTDRHTGKSTYDIFAEYGIYLIKTSNDREHGWLDLKEHLAVHEVRNEINGEWEEEANLTIDESACPELWQCMIHIQKDKPKHSENYNPNDAAKEPHELTHAPDALRAFCAGRPRPSRGQPPKPAPKLKEQLKRKKR